MLGVCGLKENNISYISEKISISTPLKLQQSISSILSPSPSFFKLLAPPSSQRASIKLINPSILMPPPSIKSAQTPNLHNLFHQTCPQNHL